MSVLNYFNKSIATSLVPTNVVQSATPTGALTGAAGADKLVGSGSGQTMTGFGGDDTYYVKSEQDKIFEISGGGIDTVIASYVKSYALAENVENLIIGGKQAWGFGNGLANILEGKNGAQILDGGRGDDVLTGGADADIFVFGTASGHDVITDFRALEGDKIRLDAYQIANMDQVKQAMTQVGADVILKLSATDAVRINNVQVQDFTADSFQLGINTSALTLSFSEEFDSLSLKDLKTGEGRWSTTFDFGSKEGPRSLASHTLLNNDEQQIYVDPNYAGNAVKGSAGLGLNPFSIQDGILKITASKVSEEISQKLFGYDYMSGLLTTETSFAQQYGYFEMRAQLPLGQGVWPAFWLLPADGTNPLELDVMEAVGGNMVHQTSHFSLDGVKSKESFANYLENPDAFHTYGMLWTAKEIAWYIDGVEVVSMPTPPDLNRPMYMLVNLAVGGNWSGTASFESASMNVDYVRAYSVAADQTAANINPNGLASSNAAPPVELAVIDGTDGDDMLRGKGASEKLMGMAGDDTLKGGLGDNIFDGGEGSDTANFSDQKTGVTVNLALAASQPIAANMATTLVSVENLVGSHYDDVLKGDGGANTLNGGAGDDLVLGGAGEDVLLGAAGADLLDGGAGDDTMDGGAGNDTASYALATGAVTVDLSISGRQGTGGAGFDTLVAVENLQGSAFSDVLTGNGKANLLDGGAGSDTLNGGKGKDLIIGGAGADTLYGGSGADTFVFKSETESPMGGADIVMDFRAREGDVIDLSRVDANSAAAGDQAFTFIGSAAFSQRQGELRIVTDPVGAHLYGDTNGDGLADLHIVLAGVASIGAADLVL